MARKRTSEPSVPIRDFEILRDVRQVRVLADPVRIEMLGLMTRGPETGTTAARALGIPPNRAHYHLGQLLEAGLVREADPGSRGRRDERFYTAVARHFLVDPELGFSDEIASRALLRSIESAFLDWRRRELLQVDLGRVARVLVHDAVRARPGEVVLVMFGPDGLELAESMVVELEAIGAIAVPKLWSRKTIDRKLERHSAQALRTLPFLPAAEDSRLDAVLFVSGGMPQGGLPTPEQQEKLPYLLESASAWHRSIRERRVRYLEISLPYRGEFEAGLVSPEAAIDAWWRSLESDPALLLGRARRILERLHARPTVRVTGKGTALEMEVDPERVLISDGVISEEDVRAGHNFEEIPAGSLAVVPIGASVEGRISAAYTFAGGRHFHQVTLTIRQGRIAEFEAKEDLATLRKLIGMSAGDPDLISELRFGLNPAARNPTGKVLLDACLEGIVTFGFGNNEVIGGDVRSTLTLKVPVTGLTLEAGGAVLVRSGRLASEIA